MLASGDSPAGNCGWATAFDVMMETDLLVQAFPVWEDDLAHPERFSNPVLIRNIVEDGIGLE